jgi:hypothetical protein
MQSHSPTCVALQIDECHRLKDHPLELIVHHLRHTKTESQSHVFNTSWSSIFCAVTAREYLNLIVSSSTCTCHLFGLSFRNIRMRCRISFSPPSYYSLLYQNWPFSLKVVYNAKWGGSRKVANVRHWSRTGGFLSLKTMSIATVPDKYYPSYTPSYHSNSYCTLPLSLLKNLCVLCFCNLSNCLLWKEECV